VVKVKRSARGFGKVFKDGVVLEREARKGFFPEKVFSGKGKINHLRSPEVCLAISNPGPGFPVPLGNQGPENHEAHLLRIFIGKTPPCDDRLGAILKSPRVELRLEEGETASQSMSQLGIAESNRRQVEKDGSPDFLGGVDHPGRRSEAIKLGHILEAFLSGFQDGSESPERDP
jgi:hypothetical protein